MTTEFNQNGFKITELGQLPAEWRVVNFIKTLKTGEVDEKLKIILKKLRSRI